MRKGVLPTTQYLSVGALSVVHLCSGFVRFWREFRARPADPFTKITYHTPDPDLKSCKFVLLFKIKDQNPELDSDL
jgi:hypothetical protein